MSILQPPCYYYDYDDVFIGAKWIFLLLLLLLLGGFNTFNGCFEYIDRGRRRRMHLYKLSFIASLFSDNSLQLVDGLWEDVRL